jgi:hypothetical protein
VSRPRPAAVRRTLSALCGVGCAVVFAAGCGGDSSGAGSDAPAPVRAPAEAVAPPGILAAGAEVRPGDDTPKRFVEALKQHKVIAVAFLYGDAADEAIVSRAVATARASTPGRAASWFVYDVTKARGFGDLAERLGVTSTPTVVVIGRDGAIVNGWTGLVDPLLLQQSLSTAREAPPT